MNTEYEEVYVAVGPLHAETIRLMLEAAGMHVITRQESAGVAIGLTVGRLGEVKILVPKDEAEAARKIILDMDEGRLSGVQFEDEDISSEEAAPDEEEDVD